MSPSHVVEPTYRRLKQDLMAGTWPPGFRLEAARLAEDLGVSMTPVRDSLNRLAGEFLVEARPGIGFSVARITERSLRDLFEFNAALLVFAAYAGRPQEKGSRTSPPAGDYAERAGQIFAAIAASASNLIMTQTICSLNDRMHLLRRLDPQFFPDCENELGEIIKAFSAGKDSDRLRHLLVSYHDRRQGAVTTYLETLEAD